jgi:hypothetical protein
LPFIYKVFDILPAARLIYRKIIDWRKDKSIRSKVMDGLPDRLPDIGFGTHFNGYRG